MQPLGADEPLAAVTERAGVLSGPWVEAGGGDTEAGDGAARTPGPSSAAGSGCAAGRGSRPGAIPARCLGTWEGRATGPGCSLPRGTLLLAVHQARTGEELGRLKQTDQISAVCTDILALTAVTAQPLATSVGAKDSHQGRDPAPHRIESTPVGDDLRYTSDSAAEGNPESRMPRAGG